jgi:hypothetical protein
MPRRSLRLFLNRSRRFFGFLFLRLCCLLIQKSPSKNNFSGEKFVVLPNAVFSCVDHVKEVDSWTFDFATDIDKPPTQNRRRDPKLLLERQSLQRSTGATGRALHQKPQLILDVAHI